MSHINLSAVWMFDCICICCTLICLLCCTLCLLCCTLMCLLYCTLMCLLCCTLICLLCKWSCSEACQHVHKFGYIDSSRWTPIVGHMGVLIEASVINVSPLSVLSNTCKCQNTTSCPFLNIVPELSLPSSSLFTQKFLCLLLLLYLHRIVLWRMTFKRVCYMSKPDKLSIFHNWKKWLLMNCI